MRAAWRLVDRPTVSPCSCAAPPPSATRAPDAWVGAAELPPFLGDEEINAVHSGWSLSPCRPVQRRAWPRLVTPIALLLACLATLIALATVTPSAAAVPLDQGQNQPPSASIGLPSAGATYRIGSLIEYAGSASDPEDGSLPSSALRWQIVQVHCPGDTCHEHVVATPTGPTGAFVIPDEHGRGTHYEFRLTATDSLGATDTKVAALHPETVQISLATTPAGLQVSLDGEVGPAPLTRTTTIGASHVIDTPSPQGAQTFTAWSDGGGQRHTVSAGSGPSTYTAAFDVLTRPTRSLRLNGTTAYAEAPHHSELNITVDWTVEAWFKDETAGGYNHDTRYLLIKGNTDAEGEAPFLIGIEWGRLVAGERTGWTNHIVAHDLGGVSAGAWHHVAASMQGSTRQLTLYLDGTQVAQGILPAQSTTGNSLPLSLGHNGTHHYWWGKLDDVRIWNVVRTAAEIQHGFHTELSNVPAGLVANWKFDEGTGTTAADDAGVAQVAVLHGSADWSTDAQSGPPPPDKTPPSISGVAAGSITTTGATISWRTDEEADAAVEYGTTAAYGTTATSNTARVSSHAVALTSLRPNTTYHYRAKSKDAAGNTATSSGATFTTLADTVPPTIDGLQATSITTTGATIVWTTNEPADSQVRYGPTVGYGSTTPRDARLVTSHAVQLTGLTPGATVHVQVVSGDEAGNPAASGDLTFRTVDPPDTTPPMISGIQATNITTTGATIVWTTSEPADSNVEYGVAASYGSSTPASSNRVVQHTMQLSQLQPGTGYSYRVRSRDAAGNLATSDGLAFTTAAPPAPPRTACTPRPNVSVAAEPAGPGALRVTVAAGTSDLLTTNTLKVLRFGAATNAQVEISGQPARPGGFDVSLPAGARHVTFVVRQVARGQAATVPLVVVDDCGDWRTFVGGGPSAF